MRRATKPLKPKTKKAAKRAPPTEYEKRLAAAAAAQVLDHVAPARPTPEAPWDAIKRSPVHRLAVLCNGEASADHDEHGAPVDGTGNKCVHYWCSRRIPELENSGDVHKGEVLRRCTKWVSADGPMEFGEGREHMANYCDAYVPSSPARPYSAATETAPPDRRDDVDLAPVAVAAPFEPGEPAASAFDVHSVYGHAVERIIIEKQTPHQRWSVHLGDADAPLVFVYFRLAYNLEEYATDHRFPVGDVRRYDKNRLYALELCLARAPLKAGDFADDVGAPMWKPILKNAPLVRIGDVLQGTK